MICLDNQSNDSFSVHSVNTVYKTADGVLGYEWDIFSEDCYRPAGLIGLSHISMHSIHISWKVLMLLTKAVDMFNIVYPCIVISTWFTLLKAIWCLERERFNDHGLEVDIMMVMLFLQIEIINKQQWIYWVIWIFVHWMKDHETTLPPLSITHPPLNIVRPTYYQIFL